MRKPPLALRLTAALISVIIFLFAAELSLGLVEDRLYYKNQFFPLNRDIDFPEIYKKDSHLFWRFRPNQQTASKQFSDLSYHINSKGMRGPEFEPEKKSFRVLALGNSCTFGWGVDYENTWATNLKQQLSATTDQTNIEVINAGVPGYSSYQGKIYFSKELLALKPDMVLISFGWNDQWPAGQGITDAEQKPAGKLIIAAQNLVSNLRLYRMMRKLVLGLSEKEQKVALDKLDGKRRVPPDQFYENLVEIIRVAKEHNIEPILLVPPVASLENYFGGTVSDFHKRHKLYQEQIIRAANYTRVQVINLQEEFDRHADLFTDAKADPVHFNKKGHQVAAETISRALAPVLVSK